MSRIIKPGDADFQSPDDRSPKKIPIGFFYKAGRCPECEMPAFIHSELPGDGTRFYRTCNCEDVDFNLTQLSGYDPFIERESLDYLFKSFELLLLALEQEQEKNAGDDGTDEDMEGAEGDGPSALPEQGEGEAGGSLEDLEEG